MTDDKHYTVRHLSDSFSQILSRPDHGESFKVTTTNTFDFISRLHLFGSSKLKHHLSKFFNLCPKSNIKLGPFCPGMKLQKQP